jgi:hypothetical protein
MFIESMRYRLNFIIRIDVANRGSETCAMHKSISHIAKGSAANEKRAEAGRCPAGATTRRAEPRRASSRRI